MKDEKTLEQTSDSEAGVEKLVSWQPRSVEQIFEDMQRAVF